MADRKLIELVIDENQDNYAIDALSLVKFPAIESDFIFLAKDNRCLSLAALDEDKRTLIGPALIPEKHIPRFDAETNDEYDVYFSKETVQRAAELFLEQSRTSEHTLEHQAKINDVHVVESWIVQDPNMDKSKAYGLSVPEGTWMVRVRVDNDEVWDSVKSGEVRGFSIEGYFVDRLVSMGQRKPTDRAMMKSVMSKVRNWLKKLELYKEAGLTTGKVIATDADEFGPGVAVYTLDEEGMPIDLPDGSYETDGGVALKVLDGTLTEYAGEVVAEVVEEEETSADSVQSDMLTSYYKKLMEVKQNKKTDMRSERQEFSYNGWRNYETWLTNMYFGDYLMEISNERFDEGEGMLDRDEVEDMVTEMIYDEMGNAGGFVESLVKVSLADIDWHSITDHANER